MAYSWWLRDAAGARRRIRSGGVLIGRAIDCDIVVDDLTTSRHQAVVYLEDEVPMLASLGTTPMRLDGRAAVRPTALRDGVSIEIGSLALTVHGEIHERVPPRWLLAHDGVGLHSIATSRFTVGGSSDDDLLVEGLVPAAIVLEPDVGFVAVQAGVDGVHVAGRRLGAGELSSARAGGAIVLHGTTLRLLTGEAVDQGRPAMDFNPKSDRRRRSSRSSLAADALRWSGSTVGSRCTWPSAAATSWLRC